MIGRPELRVEIDRQRAADLGVKVQDIAQAFYMLVGGSKTTSYYVGDEQYDVTIRANQRYRSNPEGLARMTVASNRGPVTLGELVRIERASGPSSIQRMNRERQVTLSANVAPGFSQQELITKFEELVAGLHMPADYVAEPAGQSAELARTANSFILAISLSFIFMYIVLAAQFESFLHPITILLTLPLAVPFGILSLLIAGDTINIFSGLGLLLLFGIVKKNAILQIDHTERPAREGSVPVRRDHAGEPRAAAPDPDDDARTGGRHDSAGDFERCRIGDQPIDWRPRRRRPVAVPPADAARRAGVLFAVRRSAVAVALAWLGARWRRLSGR